MLSGGRFVSSTRESYHQLQEPIKILTLVLNSTLQTMERILGKNKVNRYKNLTSSSTLLPLHKDKQYYISSAIFLSRVLNMAVSVRKTWYVCTYVCTYVASDHQEPVAESVSIH